MPLTPQLSALEKAIENKDKINTSVSEKGVAWHILHSLKVINLTCNTLINSNPDDYKWKFNKLRLFIFTKGSIPRGKGKAPKAVVPPENIHPNDIQQELEKAHQLLQQVNQLPTKSNFNHPLFGMLHRKKALRFLEMHTQHHLHIIDDIIRS
ncbi:MAG: DUF1569 domain-containing protein [Flavobacteriales bacterium]|nr:DUF1569 domain-containing protein [Flavobacteriales bacterium]